MKNESKVMMSSFGKELELNGEVLVIKPYTWMQTIKMAKPFSDVLKIIIGNYKKFSDAIESIKNVDKLTQISLIADFVGGIDGADDLMDSLNTLMAGAIGKDKSFVESLMLDEVIKLGQAVYEVNEDFFTNRLAPMMAGPKKKAEK